MLGVSGQEYQYSQLDAELNAYEGNYDKAVTAGQAAMFLYDPAGFVQGDPLPADADYGLSYQSGDYYA